MSDLFAYIPLGLASGAVYAIAAMGLVVTYKTSGIFNFGHGAVATIGAYSYYALQVQLGLPALVAVVLAVAVGALVGAVVLEPFGRALADLDVTMKVVATVGLFLTVQAGAVLLYGGSPRFVEPFLPQQSFLLGGARIAVSQVLLLLIGLASAVGLALLFKKTRIGTAMRGVVDDPALLQLFGTSPTRVRRSAWSIGSAFAAFSGVLLVPSLGLDAGLLTLLVVQAFGAAAVGAFSSLPLTFAGGLLIGVGSSISTKFVAEVPTLNGLPPSLPFIVLFVLLLVLPKRLLADDTLRSQRATTPAKVFPPRVLAAGYTLLLVALAVVPFLVGARLLVWTNGVALSVIFVSLNLLVRLSGQVSLCHAGFAAIGAAAFAKLSTEAGLPWLLALVLAGLITAPVGALIAIPAIRLSGVYLAVATFGFGILLQGLVYGTDLMFGPGGQLEAARPTMAPFDGDRGFYFAVLLVAVAVWVVAEVVRRARIGRLLRGLSGSPTALETAGADTSVMRVVVFALCAFLAGVAGGLLASSSQALSSGSFDSFTSLLWLAVLILAGTAPVFGTLFAGLLLAVVPTYLDGGLAEYLPLVFGLSAVLIPVLSGRRAGARPGGRPEDHGLRRRSPAAARDGRAGPAQRRLVGSVAS